MEKLINQKKNSNLDNTNKDNGEKEFNFVFLTDQPLTTKSELDDPKFGHREIAKALVKSIEKCPTPFTIGLFGKWGSGKSSIANLLKKDLEKKNIPVAIFDVWKHQGDALRRTFLFDLHKQLNSLGEGFFNTEYQLNEGLKSTQSRKIQGKFQINRAKIKQIFTKQVILVALLFVLFLIIGIGLLLFGGYSQLVVNFFVLLGSFVTGGIFLGLISKFITEFITTESTIINNEKFQDPKEFEIEFGKLIKQVKSKRLLVVFDNLDRVTNKRAVEVLTTIKTFLEPKDLEIDGKEVVFVIPCDADAIREHVEKVYQVKNENDGDSAFDPEEFLKKFFTTIFRIPEFIPSELEIFTRKMLKKTEVEDLDNNKVAWIITKAYRENPRQIKQFINILLANYVLIRERQGKESDFPENFLQENIAQLTKFLLLCQKFPKDMEKLRKSNRADLKDAIDNTAQIGFKESFLDFSKETISDFPMSDLRIFFTLRRSAHEKEFPGIEDFFIALEDKKIDTAITYLKSIKNYNNVQEEFSHVIKDRLEHITNDLSLVSSISTLLESLDKLGLRLATVGYSEIVLHLKNKAASYFHTISPLILSRQIVEPFGEYRSDVVGKWQDVFIDQKKDKPSFEINDEYWKELVDVLVKNSDWFNDFKSVIQEVLTKKLSAHTWVSQVFKDKTAEQIKFLNKQFPVGFINSINNQDVENGALKEKFEILSGFSKEILGESYDNIINKINELLTNENNQPLNAEREPKKQQLLENSIKVINYFEDELKTVDVNIWQPLAITSINGINSIPDWDTRKLFIPLLLVLNKFIQEPQLSESKQIVTSFFNEASIESIEIAFGKIEDEQSLIENSDYANTFEVRALNDQIVFDFLYNKISSETKSEWLIKLLDRDHNRFFEKLKLESYKIPEKTSINNKLLDKVVDQTIQDQPFYFKAINALKCPGAEAKDRYMNILKNHLTNLDINYQKIAFEALSGEDFLGKGRQRKLTKEVYDWLKEPEVSNKYQPFAIQAVMRGNGHFNDEEKNDFTQFIFDEIIRKSNDEAIISFGFDQLAILNPKYKDRKLNFNDIRTKIESEQNPSVKNVMIQGLTKLMPEKKTKVNREYWEWVESLTNSDS